MCRGIKEVLKSSAIRGIELFRTESEAAAPHCQWTARGMASGLLLIPFLLLNKSQDSVLRAQETECHYL